MDATNKITNTIDTESELDETEVDEKIYLSGNSLYTSVEAKKTILKNDAKKKTYSHE